MKQGYVKPSLYILNVKPEEPTNNTIVVTSSGKKYEVFTQHCSACRWNPDGTEAWHCDHSINSWTGKPFYPDCDFHDH